MPEAVIFDVDGTLIGSVDLHAESWVDAFHDCGHEVGFEEVRNQIGKGKILKERYLPRSRHSPRSASCCSAWRLTASTSSDDAEISKPDPDIF